MELFLRDCSVWQGNQAPIITTITVTITITVTVTITTIKIITILVLAEEGLRGCYEAHSSGNLLLIAGTARFPSLRWCPNIGTPKKIQVRGTPKKEPFNNNFGNPQREKKIHIFPVAISFSMFCSI